MSSGDAKGPASKGWLAGSCQARYVGRAGRVMIVGQKSDQGARAMGMCVLEIKDCVML